MNAEEELKKACVLEKIKEIPLPLSEDGYRKLAWIPFEYLPKEYQDELNRVMRELYEKAIAEGKLG